LFGFKSSINFAFKLNYLDVFPSYTGTEVLFYFTLQLDGDVSDWTGSEWDGDLSEELGIVAEKLDSLRARKLLYEDDDPLPPWNFSNHVYYSKKRRKEIYLALLVMHRLDFRKDLRVKVLEFVACT
jgi:hypothetical protein